MVGNQKSNPSYHFFKQKAREGMNKMKYFKIVKDLNDLKSQYRKLCREFHPDLGGDAEIMKAINNEYEDRLKSGIFNEEFEKSNSSFEIEKSLMEKINKTVCLKSVETEVCGKWLWLSGQTWRYKKWLKAEGFRWAPRKRMWYWRHEKDAWQRKGRKGQNIEKIRQKYGSMKFDQVQQQGAIT